MLLLTSISMFVPLSQIEAAGYVTRTDSTQVARGEASYRGFRADNIDLRIVITFENAGSRTGRLADGPYPATYKEGTKMPSGMPLGTDLYFDAKPTQLTVIACTPFEWSEFAFRSPIRATGDGFIERLPYDWTNHQVVAERIVRRSLAMTAGQRVADLKSRTVAGTSVSSGVCRKSDRVFGDLAAWCAARGWSMTHSDDYDYYTLRKGGKYAVVPLGSAKVKVNGVWKDGVDTVALVGGKWFLTQQALEAIRTGE